MRHEPSRDADDTSGQNLGCENLGEPHQHGRRGIPNWLWVRACVEGQHPLEVGMERAKRTSGGFSYTNALAADRNGQAIGMVLSYAITDAPTDNPEDLPGPTRPSWPLRSCLSKPGSSTRLLSLATSKTKESEPGFSWPSKTLPAQMA